jgi:hypothetical protein
MVIPDWALGVGFIIFAGATAQILVVKLRASTRTPAAPDPEVGELRQGFDALQNRVGELEERLDFTERLLANQRDAERLAPPSPPTEV